MEDRTKLINRTIQYIAERKCISIDDVTDEMIMLELADAVVKNCSILDVVGQSGQLKAEVFKLANKLAIAGEGDAAVAMHRIHNRL